MAKRTTRKSDSDTTVTPESRHASSVEPNDRPAAAKTARRRKTDELATGSASRLSARTAAAFERAAEPSFVTVQDVAEIELSHHEIAERAYHIYLERGAQPGDPFADWLTAERELRGRLVGAR
jgi:Protein of unknown function (DUF2934)